MIKYSKFLFSIALVFIVYHKTNSNNRNRSVEKMVQLEVVAYQKPVNPLDHMEICKTKRCANNDNSGRFGCARNCASCDDQSECKRWHGGIDLIASENTKFKFIYSGKKVAEGFNSSWGFFVIVESDKVLDKNDLKYEKLTVIYSHLNPSQVFPKAITQGDKLGFTGKTGNAIDQNPHLHLEIYDGKFRNEDRSNALDPQMFLASDFGTNKNNYKCKATKAASLDCCGEFKDS